MSDNPLTFVAMFGLYLLVLVEYFSFLESFLLVCTFLILLLIFSFIFTDWYFYIPPSHLDLCRCPFHDTYDLFIWEGGVLFH